jgi:methylated-DNA-[protein]-cysteine S-methyltransferase
VEEFLSGQRLCFSVPVELHGTEFQRLVWRELLAIPYGTTVSYGEIARRIGSPGASRAVGSANGRNPLSLVVPCHRVIGATGALSGYGGGLEQKRFLLLLEKKHAAPPASLRGCLGQTQHPSHQILTSQTAGSPAVCAGEAPPC